MRCQSTFHPCTGARPGAAPHLVLLPGWGMHGGVFADLLPALGARFHVTVIDLPGFGANAAVEAASLEEMAALVVDAAPLQAHWLGWSLGGMVAACVAANEPQRVPVLATVASNLSFVQRTGWPAAMAPETFAAFEQEVAAGGAAALDRFLALQCQGGVTARDDLRRLRALVPEHVPAPAALLGGLRVLREGDLRRIGEDLHCPSLWIYGAQDALVPAAVAETVARRIPQAVVKVLPGVAHVPFLGAQTQLLACLDNFPAWSLA